MKEQAHGQAGDRKKAVVIGILFATSAVITLLGLAFCVLSTVNHWQFMVLQFEMPGVIFGVIIAFLGVRYFLSVTKLKTQVYRSEAHFSWSNFRRK